jgi:hypothetical protein
MNPLEFLSFLWRNKPDALFLLIWVLIGKKSYWFQDIESATAFIESGHSHDVYVGVGLSPSANGENQRCKSEDIAALTGFWADFDLHSPAHKKPLPHTIEEALKIIPPDLPPTIIVSTGNGVHGWWLFHRPWVFATTAERNDAVNLSARFQTLLQYHSRQRGWAFERLGDLARVLRIPGTLNAKDPANPKAVEVYSVEGRRYTPDEIREYLDRAAIPDAEAEKRAQEMLQQRFSGSPLVVNLQAAVPDAQITAWCRRDPRFRRTWDHRRDDLGDQSASGYDLALASFGVRNGLSDQGIVDLIIHHRRLHGAKQRRTVDYFQRTIATARHDTPNGASDGAATGATGSHCTGNNTQTAEDPVVRKALLCDQISIFLGVRVLRLLKIPGSDPVYLMELENGRIKFDIVRLTTQRRVQLALAAHADRVIPKFKQREWEQISQMMINACTVVDGTDDLQLEGAARIYLHQYLSDVAVLPGVEGVTRRDMLKPVIFKGQVTIHTTDLHSYLGQTRKLSVPVQHLAGMLTALGGREVRIRGGAYSDQSRWGLPVDQFPPRDYQDAGAEGDGDVA